MGTGTVLMLLGFFLYLGGRFPTIISIGVMLTGIGCEFLGFFLAYLEYRKAVEIR